MNIIEMHTMCDLLLDKANAPWFSPTEKDSYLNMAHMEFAETRYRKFETDERTRKELLPLVRRSTSGTTSSINLSAISGFMFILNVLGVFTDVCGTTTTTRKISPLQLDDEGDNELDPFNRSANDNPTYTEENDGTNNIVLIKSDSAPVSYVLKYLMIPPRVLNDEAVPANNINSIMPEFTHEEIVNIAVRKMMATTEQQLNYQMQNNEINNQN